MKPWPMALPLALITAAVALAGVMAYGVDSSLARHSWGLCAIMMFRRLQWPLIVLSLILCLALLGVVISGKRRAWWLIGLAPVLAMFVHRFLTSPVNRYTIADEPRFMTMTEAAAIPDADLIIGVIFKDQPFAYPLGCLYNTPVVVQSDRERRLLLMWSPKANAATALEVARELKARDLDIPSEPAGGLLIFNSRTGQFICAVTGMTPARQKPVNVESQVGVTKTTWRQWKTMHPETRVMHPQGGEYRKGIRPIGIAADAAMVTLIGPHESPIAIYSHDIATMPLNLSAGDVAALVFRDAASGRVRALDRHLEQDLMPAFVQNRDRRRKAAFVDNDTSSGWSLDGRFVDGDPQFKGKKLAPLAVQEDVDPAAVRYWFPDVKVQSPSIRPWPGLG